MAKELRPRDELLKSNKEATYKIHGYVLYDPAENLFNGSLVSPSPPPYAGTCSRTNSDFAYWNAEGHYLDIEFYENVNIWDLGFNSSSYWSELDVYSNDNGILGDKVGVLLGYSGTFSSTDPNWVKIGSLKKGRYKIVKSSKGLRVSQEWYLEVAYTDSILIKSNNKHYSIRTKNSWISTGMTTTTSPYPLVASASTYYSASYPPWKAFNGTNVPSNNDVWISASGRVTGWIQIDYGRIVEVNRLNLGAPGDSTYVSATPKNFNILYSNDGVNFRVAKEVTGQDKWSSGEYRAFTFNKIRVRYLRIEVIANNGNSNYVAIGEISFGLVENALYELPIMTENNIIKYGSAKLTEFDSTVVTKKYVLQDNVSENTRGLLTAKLDRKPLSIGLEGY